MSRLPDGVPLTSRSAAFRKAEPVDRSDEWVKFVLDTFLLLGGRDLVDGCDVAGGNDVGDGSRGGAVGEVGGESCNLGHDVVSRCCFGSTHRVEESQGPAKDVGLVVGGLGGSLDVYEAGFNRDVYLRDGG